MYAIYALVDPVEDYKVCYVGMTSDILERYIQHLRCVDKNPAKNEWVQRLRERGYLPTLRTLEVVETELEARRKEAYWIHFYKGLHMPLTNTHIPPMSMKAKDYSFTNALSVPGTKRDAVKATMEKFTIEGRKFTYQDVANASGASLQTVKVYAPGIKKELSQ